MDIKYPLASDIFQAKQSEGHAVSTVEEWTDEQLDLAINDAYIPRIPGQVSLMREAFVALRAARTRIAELEADIERLRGTIANGAIWVNGERVVSAVLMENVLGPKGASPLPAPPPKPPPHSAPPPTAHASAR